MNYKKTDKTAICRMAVLCLITCLATAAGLFLLYTYDNKYNMDYLSQQQNGQDASFLVSGWEIYPDVLLNPRELSAAQKLPNAKPKSVSAYIGQFSSFSPFHKNAGPYGDATYRFTFSLPDDRPQTLALSLPEIFSAYRIYVNGKEAGSTGSLRPYSPAVRESVISFKTEANNEILLQTSNYTHYYSGLYYPPAMGTAEAIHRIQSIRMIFYGFLSFSSLAIAVFSICLWLLHGRENREKEANTFYFGILAVSFGLGISYPFYRTLGTAPIRALYAFEDVMTFLGICMALLITAQLAGLSRHPLFSRLLLPVASAMCFAAFFIPVIALPHLPAFTPVYGVIVSGYKLFSACVMIVFSIRCVAYQKGSCLPLCGTLCYGICLFANVWQINEYEPARTGWQDEYGRFALVLCFAAIMVKQNYLVVMENQRLNMHLEEEVKAKTSMITGLVTERQQLLSELLHDIKAPVSSISACLQLIRGHKLMLDDDTERKLALMEERCQDVSSRMQFMQTFTAQDSLDFQLHPIELCDFLTRFHQKNQPDVELMGPDFVLSLSCASCLINGDEEKLGRILENLLYNAQNHTPSEGTITLGLKKEGAKAAVFLSDTGSGIAPSHTERLFDKYFTTRTENGGQGLGLFITKKLTEELGGTIEVNSREQIGSTFTVRLPRKDIP